ncbi:hypothetical protein LAY57_27720 [Argonema antarcticum A004/B2]|nr:hypothetical protein [Argonema antarcticum A004/B2]
MGIPGKASRKGVGEKEAEPRNTPLYCKLTKSKLNSLRSISKAKEITLTDAISEATGDWIAKNAEYLTQ